MQGKSVIELKELLDAATISQKDALKRQDARYWYYRCYQAEVEWVCNCVSAVLMNEGKPVIVIPTARGAMQAAKILGVKNWE